MTLHVFLRAGIIRRRGFTLVEMLVALTATLMLMGGVASLFGYLSQSVSSGRATIELSGQLRSAALRLQEDLDSLTALTLPWVQVGSASGYFEYIEGKARDTVNFDEDLSNDFSHPAVGNTNLFGDADDILMFTARSEGRPFVGRYNPDPTTDPVLIESQLAEIIWWAQDDGQGNTKLYRRVLLIRPDLNTAANFQTLPFTSRIADFFNNNDISVRPFSNTDNGRMTANSLEDLSLRENRYAHTQVVFPYLFAFREDSGLAVVPPGTVIEIIAIQVGLPQGEDVVQGNLLAFDVKAFDPYAPVVTVSGNPSVGLLPNDPGFNISATVVGRGAYVDLNYAGNPALSLNRGFSGPPHEKAQIHSFWVNRPFYDTWPFHYEQDGIDQDGILGADQGTNGLDDNSTLGVDDPTELETSPPYPIPLRGIQVTLRVIEPDTRQVRQATVLGDFVPE